MPISGLMYSTGSEETPCNPVAMTNARIPRDEKPAKFIVGVRIIGLEVVLKSMIVGWFYIKNDGKWNWRTFISGRTILTRMSVGQTWVSPHFAALHCRSPSLLCMYKAHNRKSWQEHPCRTTTSVASEIDPTWNMTRAIYIFSSWWVFLYPKVCN